MNKKIMNIVNSVLFMLIIGGFALFGLILPDKGISVTEHKNLEKLPEFSAEDVMNGRYFGYFEEYLQENFAGRDSLRMLKAFTEYYALCKSDNNDIYICDGYAVKSDYPLDEKLIKGSAEKFTELYSELFDGCNAYYSVIPDKNYFLAEKSGQPAYDYNRIAEILTENLSDYMTYIPIYELTDITDYYRTDPHWRQEAIIPIADRLLEIMNVPLPDRVYTKSEYTPFYGTLFTHAELPFGSESLYCLTNTLLDNCTVYNPISDTTGTIYETELFDGINAYDIYLSGAEPLLEINNPAAQSKRTLYLFRDSYGSSIAPLLAESYSKIVLIDPRYISAEKVREYTDVSEKGDVLFLMSGTILNRSYLFK